VIVLDGSLWRVFSNTSIIRAPLRADVNIRSVSMHSFMDTVTKTIN